LPRSAAGATAALVGIGGVLLSLDLRQHGHDLARGRFRARLQAAPLDDRPEGRLSLLLDDGITTSQATTASLKGTRDLTEHLDVYASAGYLRNTFAGIDSLVNGEAGVGYKLLNGPSQFLRPEIGFGYTAESETTGLDRNYASARAGLAYKWQFSKSAFFTNDFSFLYDLSNSNNWIIAEKAAVTASLTSIFALRASWTLLYTNEPVLGFSATNTATAVALVAKF
jgi:putative salt-induced outer membrane protein YdiY